MGLGTRRIATKSRIAFALLFVAASPLHADETALRQQDGAGAGGGGSGTIHDQPRVESRTIDRERIAGQNGVRIYTGFGSAGARFSRPTEGREQHGKESDKESQEDEESKEDPCSESSSETTKGNPVNIATGNKIEPELDFATEGEWPLYLKRTYNHHWGGMGLFGWRWVSSFDYRLSFDTGSWGGAGVCYARPSHPECTNTGNAASVWVHHPDGSKRRFDKAPDGVYYESRAVPIAKIVRQANGTWVLYGEDNMIETYSVGGYPLSIRNEAGIGWSFRYGGLNNTQVQEVTHTSGRSVIFIWGGLQGAELREIQDPARNRYQFEYTAQKVDPGNHVLAKVIYPGPSPTTVTYHYAGWAGEPEATYAALTGKSINGVRYSWFTWANSGGLWRATGTRHANNVGKYTFTYTHNADGTMNVAEVNPLGKQASYVFRDGKILNITGHPSNQCLGAYRETSYDANGYEDLVADFNGHFTNFDYLPSGRLQQRVDAFNTPDARTTTYTWDDTRNKVASVTIGGVSRTDYTYTIGNRVASVTITNLSPNGVPGQTRTTNYSYSMYPNGLVQTGTVDGPLPNDTVTYSYSTQGDLIELRSALGHATTYSNYNALGQPGRIVGTNGEVTDYTYDERGRLTTTRAIVGGVAQPAAIYTYDGFGRLASLQTPEGRLRSREFDAAWRVSREYEAEPGGTWAVNRYTYNNASQVTSVVTERTTALNPPTGIPTLSVPGFGYNGAYSVGWSSVPTAEYYLLEEGIGSAWTEVHNGAGVTKSFTGKATGSYSYRVTACNAAGCSAPSLSAVTQVVHPPSAAPGITAPDQNTDGSFPITWNGVGAATQYQLEESVNGGAWALVHDGGTYVELVGKNAATYAYRVRGYNGAGVGPWSGVKNVVEIDPPGAPPNVFGPAVNTVGSFTVTWTSVAGATYYALEESENRGSWLAVASSGTSAYFGGRNTSIDYLYRVRACNAAGCSGYSPAIVVQRIIYGAQFVNQATPATIRPGQSAAVWVQMRNTGNTTWTAGEAFRLGSQNLADNVRWGLSRVPVPGPVVPGQVVTFSFTIIGPSGTTSGGRAFQWQMVRDGVTWFGELTPNSSIYLEVPPPPCPPNLPKCQPK